MRVGSDYYGDTVRAFDGEFRTALERYLPWRFPQDATLNHEFASSWSFAVLEAAVAAIAKAGEGFRSSTPAATLILDTLLVELVSAPRVVAAVTASDIDIAPLQRARRTAVVTVAGVSMRDVGNNAEGALEQLIPGSGYDIEREDAFAFPGRTVLMTREARGWDAREGLLPSAERPVWRLLKAIRLTSGSTCHPMLGLSGSPSRLPDNRPNRRVYRHARSFRMSHREVSIDEAYASAVEKWVAGDLRGVERTTHSDSDLGFAIDRHDQVSNDHQLPVLEKLLAISIGLEAAFGGPDRTDVGYRLRHRAAIILGGRHDPPEHIFSDVKLLYDLRSKVAHGDPTAVKQLEKVLPKVRTRVRSEWAGEQMALVMDRYADLLRRAINARIALGAGSKPLWPWSGRGPDIDAMLVADRGVREFRDRVGAYWSRKGLSMAIQPPQALAGLIALKQGEPT